MHLPRFSLMCLSLIVFVFLLFFQSTKPGRKGAIHCPRIDTMLTEDIYLPVGVPKMVLLKGYNFPPLRVKIFFFFFFLNSVMFFSVLMCVCVCACVCV